MIQQIRYALRMLFKYKLYTGVSLTGLSIAIASFWFITNFVSNTYQFDSFHEKRDRIYRLTMEITAADNTDHYATTGTPPAQLLIDHFAGVEAYAKMTFISPVVKVRNELFNEAGFYQVNSETLDVFSFDFISGDKSSCLSDPNSIVLSRLLAEKYFDNVDVIGQEVIVNEHNFIVSGVFEDWPKNTHLDIKALVASERTKTHYEPQDWFNLEQYNYVLLGQRANQNELDQKLEQLVKQHLGPALEGAGIALKFNSQPLEDLYFSEILIDDVTKGNKTYINALTIAGLCVLLIAGLNYINLLLTRSTQRVKEIQLKKVLGISQKQLFSQSLLESGIMTLLVLIIASLLVLLFDPFYFDYTGFRSIRMVTNWTILSAILLSTFLFGLLGTSYSGVYLSFSSSLINKEGSSIRAFKKGLLGFQFAIASILLIVTMTMNQQIDFMIHTDLGFSKDQVLVVDFPDNEALKDKRTLFKQQIQSMTAVQNASLIGGGALPGADNGKELFQVMIDGNKTERIYNFYRVDENYTELLDIAFAAGRNFHSSRITDQTQAVIINESLAQSLNWKNPLGQKIWYGDEAREVIGVVKNFHNKSLHNMIEPVVFLFDLNYASNLLVKATPAEVPQIEATWASIFPNVPFSLSYFDRFIDDLYAKEHQMVQLFSFFSVVSLALCCMGLFATFSLHAFQKVKEMSIRKVLGAGAVSILKSTLSSYATTAFIAIGLALPLAWYLLTLWLEGFSYKIQINPVLFILSSGLVLLMALLAVAYHLKRVLDVNPADSLSHE
ncbi:MAG: ABC transporter permease [Ekhidna sp.]|nr:ABC transporter permease [Ekhidna sp.]